MSTENILASLLFSEARTQFEGENVKNNESLHDSMSSQLEVILLTDLIYAILFEFLPYSVNHLDDMTRKAEDLQQIFLSRIDIGNIPMLIHRSTTPNMIRQMEIKNHMRLLLLNYFVSSKILRYERRKNED